MILATLRMGLPTGKKHEALDFFKMVAQKTRCFSGCLSFRIYCDIEEDEFLMAEELWTSREALHQHLQSDDYRYMLLFAETACEPPEIKFQTILSSAGLEITENS